MSITWERVSRGCQEQLGSYIRVEGLDIVLFEELYSPILPPLLTDLEFSID